MTPSHCSREARRAHPPLYRGASQMTAQERSLAEHLVQHHKALQLPIVVEPRIGDPLNRIMMTDGVTVFQARCVCPVCATKPMLSTGCRSCNKWEGSKYFEVYTDEFTVSSQHEEARSWNAETRARILGPHTGVHKQVAFAKWLAMHAIL